MKRVLVAVVACMALGAWGQTEIKGMSFIAVYERCKNAEAASKSIGFNASTSIDALICITYLNALIDRYRVFAKPPYCLPVKADIGAVIQSVISLGDALLKEPESSNLRVQAQMQGMAPLIVDGALMRSHPCVNSK